MHASLRRLADFAARPLVAGLLKVTTGNLAGNAFNFAALALLSMSLDPAPRGLFASMQAAMMLMASLADFGINTTIVKYYRELETAGRASDAEALLRRALGLRLAVAAALTGCAMIFARPICVYWLGDASSAGLFRIVSIGAFGSTLWMYCQAAMQARRQFGRYALLTIANHVLRFGLFLILLWMQRLHVAPALLVAMAVPFAGSLGAAMFWPPEFWSARMAPEKMRTQIREVVHFSKWIFLSTIIVSIIMRLDIFLLGKLSIQEQVGQFGNANDLAQGFPLLTSALSTVLLPRLAATRRREEMLRILGFVRRALPLAVIGSVLAAAAAHLLIPYLRHGAYAPSIYVFDLLIAAFASTLFSNPLSFFCLAFARARWITWMNLIQLAMSLGLGLILIPRFGAMGAGISVLIVHLFGLVYLAGAFRRLLAIAE